MHLGHYSPIESHRHGRIDTRYQRSFDYSFPNLVHNRSRLGRCQVLHRWRCRSRCLDRHSCIRHLLLQPEEGRTQRRRLRRTHSDFDKGLDRRAGSTPLFIDNAVAVIVLIVASGVDGNACQRNTLNLLSGDTRRLGLTGLEAAATCNVVFIDFSIAIIIDSIAVVVGASVGLTGETCAFFKNVGGRERNLTPLNGDFCVGGDVLAIAVETVVDRDNQALALGEEVAGRVDPAFNLTVRHRTHKLGEAAFCSLCVGVNVVDITAWWHAVVAEEVFAFLGVV